MNQVIFDSDIMTHFLKGNKKVVRRFEAHIQTNELISILINFNFSIVSYRITFFLESPKSQTHYHSLSD